MGQKWSFPVVNTCYDLSCMFAAQNSFKALQLASCSSQHPVFEFIFVFQAIMNLKKNHAILKLAPILQLDVSKVLAPLFQSRNFSIFRNLSVGQHHRGALVVLLVGWVRRKELFTVLTMMGWKAQIATVIFHYVQDRIFVLWNKWIQI